MKANHIVLVGRLAADPVFTPGAKPEQDRAWCRLAVERERTNGDNKKVDYIPFITWGAVARAISQYCRKGKELLVEGELHTFWDTEKQKFYAEVNASFVSFGADAKNQGTAPAAAAPSSNAGMAEALVAGLSPEDLGRLAALAAKIQQTKANAAAAASEPTTEQTMEGAAEDPFAQ